MSRPACGKCGTPYTLCGHRFEPCSYTTSTADYCHAHGGHLADSMGRCDRMTESSE